MFLTTFFFESSRCIPISVVYIAILATSWRLSNVDVSLVKRWHHCLWLCCTHMNKPTVCLLPTPF
jgi:hypothetical protein